MMSIKKLSFTSPGEMLLEELLKPLNVRISQIRISQITKEVKSVDLMMLHRL